MLLIGLDTGEYWIHILFAIYLDDLSIELNNIKAGCYIS